jgi:8-oxo-dGTP pyrophosphatase MutT (NUDIX family)
MDLSSIHVQSRAVIVNQKHILLCKTTGLNQNFYFLPGGHIEHGESAKDAMIRELMEELGMEFKIQRFLGCLEYSFDPQVSQHAKCHTHEYNFVFEVSSEFLPSCDQSLKQIEKHIELCWSPLMELDLIDLRPKPLKTLILKWLSLDLNDAWESLMV